jgi:hypothetical protein
MEDKISYKKKEREEKRVRECVRRIARVKIGIV